MAKRIKDYRALYGAISLFLIGLVLSFQSLIYVNMDYFGAELTTARWHWEIVLNIQILCCAFIWFSHHNRILFSEGWWKVRAILHFLVSFGAVCMPAILTVLGAWNDWYRNPPGPEMSKYMISIAIYIWVGSNLILPVLLRLIARDVSVKKIQPLSIAKLVTAVVMLVLFAMNDYLPFNLGFYGAPFLCFLHGAITYVEKSLKVPYYDRGTNKSRI
ncbi:MAG: hypothetical protein JJ850_09825 [Kordiimonadaceae bacterium]|nr:hypothetical protein [Kordiimonadaceae bacterium]MBO6569430.1 hypothetical protein [Kordiimonadaceae bacterium]MBO6964905.1 hypothetical protein [Kordiimonadaceae bacterium]